MELPNSAPANVQSLYNWIEGTKSICLEEAAFLNEQDLCTTYRASDDGLAAAENLVEQFIIWLYKLTGKVSISYHPHIMVNFEPGNPGRGLKYRQCSARQITYSIKLIIVKMMSKFHLDLKTIKSSMLIIIAIFYYK